jgi:hypothetical protein
VNAGVETPDVQLGNEPGRGVHLSIVLDRFALDRPKRRWKWNQSHEHVVQYPSLDSLEGPSRFDKEALLPFDISLKRAVVLRRFFRKRF